MNSPLTDYFSSLKVEIGANDCILLRDDASAPAAAASASSSERHHSISATSDNININEKISISAASSDGLIMPRKLAATASKSKPSLLGDNSHKNKSLSPPRRKGSLETSVAKKKPFDDFMKYDSLTNIQPPLRPRRRSSLPLTSTELTSPCGGSCSTSDYANMIQSPSLSTSTDYSPSSSNTDYFNTVMMPASSSSCATAAVVAGSVVSGTTAGAPYKGDTSPIFPVRRGSFDSITSPMKSPKYFQRQQGIQNTQNIRFGPGSHSRRSLPPVGTLLSWIKDPIILSPPQQQKKKCAAGRGGGSENLPSPATRAAYIINQIEDALAVSSSSSNGSSNSNSNSLSSSTSESMESCEEQGKQKQ